MVKQLIIIKKKSLFSLLKWPFGGISPHTSTQMGPNVRHAVDAVVFFLLPFNWEVLDVHLGEASWLVVSTPPRNQKNPWGANDHHLNFISGGQWKMTIVTVNVYKYVKYCSIVHNHHNCKYHYSIILNLFSWFQIPLFYSYFNYHLFCNGDNTIANASLYVPAALVKVFIAGFSPWRSKKGTHWLNRWSRILRV